MGTLSATLIAAHLDFNEKQDSYRQRPSLARDFPLVDRPHPHCHEPRARCVPFRIGALSPYKSHSAFPVQWLRPAVRKVTDEQIRRRFPDRGMRSEWGIRSWSFCPSAGKGHGSDR